MTANINNQRWFYVAKQLGKLLLYTIVSIVIVMSISWIDFDQQKLSFTHWINDAWFYFQLWRLVLYSMIILFWRYKVRPSLIKQNPISAIRRIEFLVLALFILIEFGAHYQRLF